MSLKNWGYKLKNPNDTTKKALKDTRESVGVKKPNILKCKRCPACRGLDDVDDTGEPSFACDVFGDYCSLSVYHCNREGIIHVKACIEQDFRRAKETHDFDIALVTAVMDRLEDE